MTDTELASTAWYDGHQKVVSTDSGTTPHGRDIFDGDVVTGVGADRAPVGNHEPTDEEYVTVELDGTDHRIDDEAAAPTDGVPSSAHRRLRHRGAGP